jgi:hypothetical protein
VSGLFLTRARLKRDPDVQALKSLLLPYASGPRLAATHRLVWSLFAEDPEARRDFLFRDGRKITRFWSISMNLKSLLRPTKSGTKLPRRMFA